MPVALRYAPLASPPPPPFLPGSRQQVKAPPTTGNAYPDLGTKQDREFSAEALTGSGPDELLFPRFLTLRNYSASPSFDIELKALERILLKHLDANTLKVSRLNMLVKNGLKIQDETLWNRVVTYFFKADESECHTFLDLVHTSSLFDNSYPSLHPSSETNLYCAKTSTVKDTILQSRLIYRRDSNSYALDINLIAQDVHDAAVEGNWKHAKTIKAFVNHLAKQSKRLNGIDINYRSSDGEELYVKLLVKLSDIVKISFRALDLILFDSDVEDSIVITRNFLREFGSTLRHQYSYGVPLSQKAIVSKRLDVLKYLSENLPLDTATNSGISPLHTAVVVYDGTPDFLNLLLDLLPDESKSPTVLGLTPADLATCLYQGEFQKTVLSILDHGGSVKAKPLTSQEIKAANLVRDVVREYQFNPGPALYGGACDNDKDTMTLAMRMGAPLDAALGTAMAHRMKDGDGPAWRLIEAGADASLAAFNRLKLPSKSYNPDDVKFLLENGATSAAITAKAIGLKNKKLEDTVLTRLADIHVPLQSRRLLTERPEGNGIVVALETQDAGSIKSAILQYGTVYRHKTRTHVFRDKNIAEAIAYFAADGNATAIRRIQSVLHAFEKKSSKGKGTSVVQTSIGLLEVSFNAIVAIKGHAARIVLRDNDVSAAKLLEDSFQAPLDGIYGFGARNTDVAVQLGHFEALCYLVDKGVPLGITHNGISIVDTAVVRFANKPGSLPYVLQHVGDDLIDYEVMGLSPTDLAICLYPPGELRDNILPILRDAGCPEARAKYSPRDIEAARLVNRTVSDDFNPLYALLDAAYDNNTLAMTLAKSEMNVSPDVALRTAVMNLGRYGYQTVRNLKCLEPDFSVVAVTFLKPSKSYNPLNVKFLIREGANPSKMHKLIDAEPRSTLQRKMRDRLNDIVEEIKEELK